MVEDIPEATINLLYFGCTQKPRPCCLILVLQRHFTTLILPRQAGGLVWRLVCVLQQMLSSRSEVPMPQRGWRSVSYSMSKTAHSTGCHNHCWSVAGNVVYRQALSQGLTPTLTSSSATAGVVWYNRRPRGARKYQLGVPGNAGIQAGFESRLDIIICHCRCCLVQQTP